MRDQRNIHVGVGDALLHLQTGIEYTVTEADDTSGKLVLEMTAMFVRGPNARKDGEIPLQGFLKIPRLNDEVTNESRAKAIIAGFGPPPESALRKFGHSALRFIKGKGLEKFDPNPTER